MRSLNEFHPNRTIVTATLTALLLAVLWLVVSAIYALL